MKARAHSVKQRWIILRRVWYSPYREEHSVKQQKPLTTREVQLLELEILKAFDAFANKHSIPYHLAYGTLLGAVRHKGFIPWDDDIDVLVPRPEYERLLDLLEREGLGKRFTVASPRNRSKNHPYPYAKLLLNDTVVHEPKLDSKFSKSSIWIDIFPLDGLPNAKACRAMTFFWALALKNLLYTAIVSSKHVSGIQKLAVLLLGPITRMVGIGRWVDWTERFATRHSYDEAKLVGNLVLTEGRKETIEKEIASQTITLEFEGHPFPAPKHYDEYLTQLYGSYMELPPVEQRTTHLGNQVFLMGDHHE